ncbi:Cyclin-A2-2 [Glycine soja]
MVRENAVMGGASEERGVRVTRAMARAVLGGVSASSRPSFKKQHKNNKGFGRVALADVTNISKKGCATSKSQARGGYKKTNTKGASNVSIQVLSTQEDVRAKLAKDLPSISMVQSHDANVAERQEGTEVVQPSMSVMAGPLLSMQDSMKSDEILRSPNKDVDMMITEKLKLSDGLDIVDIDSVELKDPQVWSSYAPDIYNSIFVREFERRPSSDYMDMLQQDITPSMRGILIDWLVEVSEEYKLLPDTLYLTVNLIDRSLSQSLVQKQRLQLLGVTCMLIASRFILASQSSYKVSYVELEFLANYLAELTLVEYSFLQFLPSLIAASAVLLARWTLNQSEHPWNSTMEHYTNYKVSELKTTVLALADLQHDMKGCSLNSIREKYKQQKFRSVANLSPKPVQSLFKAQV